MRLKEIFTLKTHSIPKNSNPTLFLPLIKIALKNIAKAAKIGAIIAQ